jgi:hypothetical protein
MLPEPHPNGTYARVIAFSEALLPHMDGGRDAEIASTPIAGSRTCRGAPMGRAGAAFITGSVGVPRGSAGAAG